jgi:hypothetical protein
MSAMSPSRQQPRCRWSPAGLLVAWLMLVQQAIQRYLPVHTGRGAADPGKYIDRPGYYAAGRLVRQRRPVF